VRVIFTGYADLKAVIDAVNRGEIFRYLTKPIRVREFNDTLSLALAFAEENHAAAS